MEQLIDWVEWGQAEEETEEATTPPSKRQKEEIQVEEPPPREPERRSIPSAFAPKAAGMYKAGETVNAHDYFVADCYLPTE